MHGSDLLRPARAVLAACDDEDTEQLERAILWLRCVVLDDDLADARSELAFKEHTIQNLQATIDQQTLALQRAERQTKEQGDLLNRAERTLEAAAELLAVGPLDQVPEAIRALQRQLASALEATPAPAAERPRRIVVCPYCHGEKHPSHPARCTRNPNRIAVGARTNGHVAEPLAEVAADADPT